MLHRIVKGFIRLLLIIRKINWIEFFRYYDIKSDVILWIPKKKLNYFIGDAILWDSATIHSFLKTKKKFKIFYGNKIGTLRNKKIFHTLNRGINVFSFNNYREIYNHVARQLEIQENTLHPSMAEISYWENKGYMHEQFKKFAINEPKTNLISFKELDFFEKVNYPFLVKEEHAFSAKGIHKVDNIKSLKSLVESAVFKSRNQIVIIQELVNMRKDLRVILVGNEIVHFYWRINKSSEWKPTSTSFGSEIDFDNFPEIWRDLIITNFKKFNITTGAFDITWENDDIISKPLFLEISPVYQPNPNIDLKGKEYIYYKKSFSPFNRFDSKFIDLIFEIKMKQMEYIYTLKN
jgi:glutathione synthase/RimK-type ligase-like ATP-grasp enzyme